MLVRHIDPRDIDSEVEHPVYRVSLWERLPAHGESQSPALRCEEVEVEGAETVTAVIDWARKAAGPTGTFVVYARRDATLLRLYGHEPAG